jgi:hypothetical protein
VLPTHLTNNWIAASRNSTLFLVAYDDTGSYFDHIIPPYEGVPAPDAPCNSLNQGFPTKFDFRRLGGRSTALLAGGRVPNKVFQEPQRGPHPSSQFDLASIASTVHRLFNLSTALTMRTMWSAPFDELLLDGPRDDADMPMHLPEAPPASAPWEPPQTPAEPDDDDDDDDDDGDDDNRRKMRAMQEGGVTAQHCGSVEQSCRGHDVLSIKQERLVHQLAAMTHTQVPVEIKTMGPKEADAWVRDASKLWRELGYPTV